MNPLAPTQMLKNIPLFKNLAEDDLALVATQLYRESYPKGATVFNKGDFGDTLYLIESGQVAVVGEDSKETIAFLGPGSFVGEISLLLASPRSATLQVMLDARMWTLSKTSFERLINTRPAIALEMMREMSKRLVTTTQGRQERSHHRRITAVFGSQALDLARALSAELNSPIGVLVLPGAQAAVEATPSRSVRPIPAHNLTAATLAEQLSHQVELFKHVLVVMPNQFDPIADKALELADTVVSIGALPAWFLPAGRSDLWTTTGSASDLARLARRLVNRTIGLALSSGGSRGLAHIGVMKVLLEENIPIDMIAGTSAGALFGALYALGWSIERLIAFGDELKSATKISNWDFNFPPRTALVKGRIARDKLIARWVNNKNFEDAQTPIYMVATDAYTGEEIVFDSGPLADAIRASLSIPVLTEPWYYRGRYHLDGGIVNPLPSSVLHKRGADIIIGSSVVQPMGQSYQGDTHKMPTMMQTISNVFSAMEAEAIEKEYDYIDVLIQHRVSAGHALDFDQATSLIELGEQTARDMLPAIKTALAVTPAG
ncbi:MAG: patatin-like phospholipase family protein [Anaerolineaceae bacterium]|nr:patatin-like phospholipase family protein [Anaerolineaceae bacterium]MCB9098928.1 patatin-like phospholipase family protein [Anaerolineales bacterium]